MIGLNVKVAHDRRVWVVVRDDGEKLIVRYYEPASGRTFTKSVHRHDVTWRQEPDVGWVPTNIETYV